MCSSDHFLRKFLPQEGFRSRSFNEIHCTKHMFISFWQQPIIIILLLTHRNVGIGRDSRPTGRNHAGADSDHWNSKSLASNEAAIKIQFPAVQLGAMHSVACPLRTSLSWGGSSQTHAKIKSSRSSFTWMDVVPFRGMTTSVINGDIRKTEQLMTPARP